MIIKLEDKAIAEIESLLNQMPISTMKIVQKIGEVLKENQVTDEDSTKNKNGSPSSE